jgi:hypothetical protein
MAKTRYVSTFRAPSEYERQMEEARRRAMLAEALAQQQYEPMEGNAAPIPKAAPLVKALQSFMTARADRQAEEAKAAAEKAGRTEAVDYIRSFEPEQRNVNMAELAAMEAPMPMVEGGRVSYAPPSAVAAPNQRLMPVMGADNQPDFSQPMQMQVGGPLTIAQKRARALEGLESTNPMVQQFAMSQYEATAPKPREVKIADLDASKYTPESLAEAQRTGDIGKIKEKEAPTKPKTIVKEVDLGNVVELHYSDGSVQTRTKGVAPSAGGGSKETAEGLRKEFTTQTTPYRGVADAFQKIKTAALNPSAANDLSLIFGYMRALDPASTVREGEFANAQNAGGIDATIRNLYNKVASGERLTQSQRQDFLQSAYGLVESQAPNVQQAIDRYTAIAGRSGLNPEDIVSDPFASVRIPRLQGDNDPMFEKLKSGDLFIAPNGKIMRKR